MGNFNKFVRELAVKAYGASNYENEVYIRGFNDAKSNVIKHLHYIDYNSVNVSYANTIRELSSVVNIEVKSINEAPTDIERGYPYHVYIKAYNKALDEIIIALNNNNKRTNNSVYTKITQDTIKKLNNMKLSK